MAGVGHSLTLEEKKCTKNVKEYFKNEKLALADAVKEGKANVYIVIEKSRN